MRYVRQSLTDDLTGGPASQTVSFGLDGITYEIDLSDANAVTLRGMLAPYVAHGRRVRSRPKPEGGTRGRPSRDKLQHIRLWARENGHEISNRGPIPKPILNAYVQREQRF